MDAENYKNRYRAVLEFANGAMFNVAELDAWATLNKVPVAFQKLFSSDGLQRDPHHHFVSYEILSNTIASNLVPEGMNPNDAKVQLMAAHDNVEPPNPVSRLRDLMMVRYDRLLLCAVYDGELNLYDTLTCTKVDVKAARLGYSENPDAFLQRARARIVGAAQGAVTPVPIVATLFIDPVRKYVPVGEIVEMTARAVHPEGSIVWAAALEYHSQELDAAIRRGEIHGFEPSTMRSLTGQLTSLPLKGAPLANAWVPVADVQKFASGVGVKVTFDFSEVKYVFMPEARAAIASESHWSETELESLCLGVPPAQYHDDCAPEAERVPIRQAILAACKSGKLDAHETGAGNAVYGGKWSIERVSAVRWAITNHFDRFPEWLARSCHAEIWKQQDEERRTAGRYTLHEAADALEQHTGTIAKDWVVKLEQAVRNDHLLVYRPGEQARYRPKTVRADYDEAYWDDLNTWLKAHEPRVKFQFAAPIATETSSQRVAKPGTANEPASAPNTDSVSWTEQAHTLKQIQEQADLWALRQPARLYGAGFSEKMQKQTTLSRYLDFDTWTPEAAAMLVCGLQAPIIDGQLCTEIPEKGAMGLDNCLIMGSQDPFHEAKRVLGIWRSQVSSPARVRPLDFVRWCQSRGFDTAWLQSIEEDALNAEREDMKAAGRPEFLAQDVTPDARELSTVDLTCEQWDRMTGTQRQSALQAIADTKAYSEQVARQADERRALGRYTLNEAAKAIAASGERFEALLEKLCGAAQRGDLPMHAPGERARYEYTNGKQVRPFYEEAYWNDLDTWLERFEPRVTFRFPVPVAPSNPNIDLGATADMNPCPDDFTLYWLNRKIDEDASFAEQAMVALQRRNEQRPKVLHDTTTLASAGSALVNEWLVNRDLPCSMRGRPVDDFAALTLEPGSCSLSDTMDILESDIHLCRDDVIRLLKREGMSVPQFLRGGSPSEGPAKYPADAGQTGSGAFVPVAGDVTETPAPEAEDGEAGIAAPLRVTTHTLRSRGDLLTPVIQRVVMATGSYDSNVVFPRLREMAIGEEEPFNGVDKDSLLWTDASGKKRRLNRKALAERLRPMGKRGEAG